MVKLCSLDSLTTNSVSGLSPHKSLSCIYEWELPEIFFSMSMLYAQNNKKTCQKPKSLDLLLLNVVMFFEVAHSFIPVPFVETVEVYFHALV